MQSLILARGHDLKRKESVKFKEVLSPRRCKNFMTNKVCREEEKQVWCHLQRKQYIRSHWNGKEFHINKNFKKAVMLRPALPRPFQMILNIPDLNSSKMNEKLLKGCSKYGHDLIIFLQCLCQLWGIMKYSLD